MVTRFSGSGRSSDVSQKSSECLAIISSVKFGAMAGAPARSVTASSLPTNEMCPMGVGPVVRAEVEVVHPQRLLEHCRIRALGNRHQNRVGVAHVVTSYNVRAVG